MKMGETDFLRQMIQTTREYRDRVLKEIDDSGLIDLSFRPSTGMSSLGWLLAHQGAVYDFSLNVLLLDRPPSRPELFKEYVPGTTGDWKRTALEEMLSYYDASEGALIDWIQSQKSSDLDAVIDRENIPKFFCGMSVREVLCNLFAHLNRHTGHLEALRRDFLMKTNHQI